MKKFIPDHILYGSIIIGSVDAFASVIQEFPGRPELLRMYADLLAAHKHGDAAIKHYDEAACLFLDAGRLFQGWICKLLQWQLQRPSRDQLLEFHRALAGTAHNGAPVDGFIKNLTPAERMAVFSQFGRMQAPAGRTLLKAGERQTHLYLVVSGVLKETSYEMVSQKPRFRREASRVVWEADCFGDVYPFSDQIPAQSHVVSSTRVELAMISRQRLMRACRRYPNVEKALISLCRIRFEKKTEKPSNGVRKGERYRIPTRMSVEIVPLREGDPSMLIKGFSHDLSVSGVSFIPERNGTPPEPQALSDAADLLGRSVRVTIPAEDVSLAIAGQIARIRPVMINGHRLQSLGIQFAEIPPRLRGLFFAFADSAKDADPPSP